MVDKHEKEAKKPANGEETAGSEAEAHVAASSDSEQEEWDESGENEELDDDASDKGDDDDDDAGETRAESNAARRADSGGAVERAASRAAEAHDHGLAHVTPLKLLIGVFGALVVLTVLTVTVTSVDLGSQGNFIVAMIIATIKAGLVMAFFMHLVWDRKFNLTVFLSAFLFVLLFLSLSITDRNEYQANIDQYEQMNPAQPQAEGTAEPKP